MTKEQIKERWVERLVVTVEEQHAEIARLQAQLETAKMVNRPVSKRFMTRAQILAREIVHYGMQTDTPELDLTTADFLELWQIAQKMLQEIEQKEQP